MPTNHTANYNLSQWVKSDQVKMEDFNADNAKIDSAIKAAQQKADNLATSKADVSALNTEISARTAAVTAETNARTAAVTAETNARTAAVNAEASARTAAVNALNTAVSKLGNCQIQRFTYTGNGGTQTLTFPYKPLLVLLTTTSGNAAAMCVYGMTTSTALDSRSTSFSLTWSGNSLSWSSLHTNAAGGSYLGIALYAKD